ncbi:MAG: histidine utilization repressor [Pseudomonadota bacterium]|uniref:histidine utilization repressor n=1 Tax=unclassified Phenylobacterium TaxID=2640670 RepID=UPI001F28C420|nr:MULTISPECIES: histidine utilization repressor [unclassified Phenylobacterium]
MPSARLHGVTLHERIRASIENKIVSGVWRPGDRIPSEYELVQEFSCSRMTVSKAIGDLVRAGLVLRRRKAGSFVAQPPIHSAILDVPDIAAEIRKRGHEYDYRLLKRNLRDPDHAKSVECDLAGNGQLVALQCLHSANGRPFAFEERLISVEAVPQSADADFSTTPPGTWLLGRVPWTTAEHRIAAIGAGAATARLLDVAAGKPCLLLERRTWHAGKAVTQVWQTFPGTSYDLTATFEPTRSQ